MLKKIPITLIYLRILTGIVLLWLSYSTIQHFAAVAITLITFGLLSDIFDGIIARKLGVSTEKMRRLDSSADQIFWVLVTISLYLHCSGFFHTNYVKLIILFSMEALTYIVSFIKFKKEVATHAIASKFWVLTIFATLVQVIITCQAGWLFQLCYYVGLLTRLEIIIILLLLRQWTNDVPSVYHAIRLRRGKPIKRNKLFNG